MSMLLVLVLALAALVVGGLLYSKVIARGFGEDPGRPTPATLVNDGRDYVPTPTTVVFGHHFSSIAGAGPILGPVLAVCFGWLPAVLWVVLGGLFIGAVHDYTAAFMSLRNGGQSVATIARRLFGRGPFIALVLFLVIALSLVTAVFLNTSATALVSMLEFDRMGLSAGQTLFRLAADPVTGQQKIVIGGIASMSVIVITCFAPLVGWLYIKRKVAVWKCSLLAGLICAVSIVIGLNFPVNLPSLALKVGINGVDFVQCALLPADLWKIALSAYVLFAAAIPVWLFLQSRDFINVHILYAGVVALLVTLVVASLRGGAPGPGEALPAIDIAAGTAKHGMFWPALFITIACGAVSGFHSLCAGGTTCKQLKSESAARYIGYWGMLLETLFAVCVIAILVIGTTKAFYFDDVFPVGKGSNPVLGFAFAVGTAANIAFGLPIAVGALAGMLMLEGFVITTLDTAVRLNRYLIEEVWQEFFGKYDVLAARTARSASGQPDAGDNAAGSAGVPTRGLFRGFLNVLQFYWTGSAVAVGLMLWLSFSGGILQLWSIFATANQLLAGFVLGIGAVWLLRNGRKAWYVLVPALFMLATTIASLILLLSKFLPRGLVEGKPTGSTALFAADVVMMALTAYLVVVGILELLKICRQGREKPESAASAS